MSRPLISQLRGRAGMIDASIARIAGGVRPRLTVRCIRQLSLVSSSAPTVASMPSRQRSSARSSSGNKQTASPRAPIVPNLYCSPCMAEQSFRRGRTGRRVVSGQGPAIVRCAGMAWPLDQSPVRRKKPTNGSASGTGIKIDWIPGINGPRWAPERFSGEAVKWRPFARPCLANCVVCRSKADGSSLRGVA